MNKIKSVAMNIVNQILDLAETPVDKRQAINDQCDEFVSEVLQEYFGQIDTVVGLRKSTYLYYFTDVDTGEKCVIEQEYKSEKNAFNNAFKKMRHYGEQEIRLDKVVKPT